MIQTYAVSGSTTKEILRKIGNAAVGITDVTRHTRERRNLIRTAIRATNHCRVEY
ncbi:hypothetical protein KKF61_09140 [Patescibacteria group bacterium]|nr:hypothetical protein [Patescibacteria group bacterium]